METVKNSTRKITQRWRVLLIVLIIGYVVVLVVLSTFQRYLVFQPDRTFIEPAEAGMTDFELVKIHTSDGETLNAWYTIQKGEKSRGKFILFFHGNGLSLAKNRNAIANLARYANGMLAIDYRGYGGSTGVTDADGLYDDARSTVAWLKQQGISMENTVVVSWSLGTALAARTARTEKVAGAVFFSPYSTIRDVAKSRFPIFPVDLLLKHNLDPAADIAHVTAPILVLHGDSDWVVFWTLGKKFFEAATGSRKMITMENDGHSFIRDPHSHAFEYLGDFLEKIAPLDQLQITKQK